MEFQLPSSVNSEELRGKPPAYNASNLFHTASVSQQCCYFPFHTEMDLTKVACVVASVFN